MVFHEFHSLEGRLLNSTTSGVVTLPLSLVTVVITHHVCRQSHIWEYHDVLGLRKGIWDLTVIHPPKRLQTHT